MNDYDYSIRMASLSLAVDNHVFLAWSALWLGWIILLLPLAVFRFLFEFYSRTYRTILILVRGWPPAGINGDGSFKTEPVAKTDAVVAEVGKTFSFEAKP